VLGRGGERPRGDGRPGLERGVRRGRGELGRGVGRVVRERQAGQAAALG